MMFLKIASVHFIIYFYFILFCLRIFTQAVYTSYLWTEINDSPIHKYKHIYTLLVKIHLLLSICFLYVKSKISKCKISKILKY